MKHEKYNNENVNKVDWEENYFKFCEFNGFSRDGGTVDSDFVDCNFSSIDWYWGLFTNANFIDCAFKKCTFRGTSFADCKFIMCTFEECNFISDNVGGHCTFERVVDFGCKGLGDMCA